MAASEPALSHPKSAGTDICVSIQALKQALVPFLRSKEETLEEFHHRLKKSCYEVLKTINVDKTLQDRDVEEVIWDKLVEARQVRSNAKIENKSTNQVEKAVENLSLSYKHQRGCKELIIGRSKQGNRKCPVFAPPGMSPQVGTLSSVRNLPPLKMPPLRYMGPVGHLSSPRTMCPVRPRSVNTRPSMPHNNYSRWSPESMYQRSNPGNVMQGGHQRRPPSNWFTHKQVRLKNMLGIEKCDDSEWCKGNHRCCEYRRKKNTFCNKYYDGCPYGTKCDYYHPNIDRRMNPKVRMSESEPRSERSIERSCVNCGSRSHMRPDQQVRNKYKSRMIPPEHRCDCVHTTGEGRC